MGKPTLSVLMYFVLQLVGTARFSAGKLGLEKLYILTHLPVVVAVVLVFCFFLWSELGAEARWDTGHVSIRMSM